jgi:hypothetical protein
LSSRLRELARGAPAASAADPDEQCDLCGRPIPAEHRHLLELASRELMCACQPCSVLFDKDAASEGRYRKVPDRRVNLAGFELSDEAWEALSIPVDMAFFFRSAAEGRVMAYYPSPAGPTESLLGLDAWSELEAANPVLGEMDPDVEALLVNRARGARQHFLVPIDDCYRLVGLIRTRWRGFTGGKEVWQGIADFFEDLERSARSRQAKPMERSAAHG